METLADFINSDVDILSIGINPSPNAVRQGYPFATPQNRFWPALNKSNLIERTYIPGKISMRALLEHEHIGFTDVVKRPTPGISELRAEDYRVGAQILLGKIDQYEPQLLWFQGKVGYRMFCRYGFNLKPESIDWGLQTEFYNLAPIFVTPNPSPANATYSLDDIVGWFDKLASFSGRDRTPRT